METMIEFKDVSKQFDEGKVLNDINLKINQGEIFVLVGPSGSGKTTSLKMINGLVEPTDGDVYFKNKRIKEYNIQKLRFQIGYVLQQIALFPTMTVKENIEVIPEMLGWTKDARSRRVNELMSEVDLDPETYRDRMPAELSGGQGQRIGIIRALAAEPDLILMDEPFSALDPISRNSLQDLVLELHEKLNNTIVFVTHNMKEAMKLGDRIAVMRDGKVIQCATPEEIQKKPADEFVLEFFDETQDENNVKTLADLVSTDNYEQTTVPENQTIYSLDTTLNEAYEVLAKQDLLFIRLKTGSFGKITRQSMFCYLSREDKK
ncbi:ABC transporter ATP-binding protein [Enterococcus sp. AZ103]|uniref:ABC transporter ATP-binding protein n=1 Tax=Enterococcus sp. AZ103 TaxID=2774628 RepID=UPI003F21D40E